ncbi:MAG: AAA family ATPase [Planctomycetaceae bacterium]|nr:AAA family ATPase [Planctomycetaceae bacterium]
MSEHIEIGGVTLHLAQPDVSQSPWIGQNEVLKQVLACWLVIDEQDLPLAPRLIGVPGIGKTTLALAAARQRQQSAYIYQCTADTRPEDLLVTPVLGEKGTIQYHASALVTAMIKGGVCVLDEGNRMNEKSWASLAPLLDHRRYVESIVAGITIQASDDFRCAVTMNDDESTFEIPDYILSRLQPTLMLTYPSREDEMAILKYHLPFANADLLNLTVEFLQQAHGLKLDFSTRDGLNVLRYALKRIAQDPEHPLSQDKAWAESLATCLGEDAVDLEEMAKKRGQALGGNMLPMGLGDFFFSPQDPLHPDFNPEQDDDFDDDDLDQEDDDI